MEADPVGGVLVASASTPFTTADLDGTLFSSVYSGDTSNPLGGLTFTYQVFLSPNSLHKATKFSVGSYANSQTDASYQTGGGVAPNYAERGNDGGGFGDIIGFGFGPGDALAIPAGANSALLVVQTDFLGYQSTLGSIANGDAAASLSTFAPAVIPEPSTAALSVMGGVAFLFGILAMRRKA